jgi:2-keto-3-deoxy-L-rhamnonate aldolase RhmA
MGYPGQMDHPKVQAAIDDAVARIAAAKKAPASSHPGHRAPLPRRGARFLYVSLAAVLDPGAKDFLAAFKA